MLSPPDSNVGDSDEQPPQAAPFFLSRLDRMASHSLCTLRSQRRRRPRNTRYRLARYALAGQVHLLLRHFTRFLLLHASSSSVFVWRNESPRINRKTGALAQGTGL